MAFCDRFDPEISSDIRCGISSIAAADSPLPIVDGSRYPTITNPVAELKGVGLAFDESPSFNELVLEIAESLPQLLCKARDADLQIGVDVTGRSYLPSSKKILKFKSKIRRCRR